MTSENGTGMVMPVAPYYGGGNGGGWGMDGFGGGWGLLILLAVLGWGNGGFGGFGGGGMFPWMMGGMANTNNDVQRGFDQAAVMSGINSLSGAVTSGFGDVQTALCGGFAGVNASIAGAAANAETAANARAMAAMQQSFASQTANAQGFNNVGTGIADLKYTVATENCADRTAAAQNTRDIIDAQTRSTQAILDKLCALELDGVKGQLAAAQRENLGLQNQLNMATIQNGLNGEVDALYNRLKSCPVPSMPVYGNTPIFTCQNNGCGCGSF